MSRVWRAARRAERARLADEQHAPGPSQAAAARVPALPAHPRVCGGPGAAAAARVRGRGRAGQQWPRQGGRVLPGDAHRRAAGDRAEDRGGSRGE